MAVQRILIGVDFSAGSLAAARWAARHLVPRAELIVAHVVPAPPAPTFLRGALLEPAEYVPLSGAATRRALRAVVESVGDVRCVSEVRGGEPGEQLAALADEHEVELIVIGRTGERRRGGKQLGTTADRLLHWARVPVLLAAGPMAEPPRRVLTAVDDGEGARDVLAWGGRVALASGAALAAVHVIGDALRAMAASRWVDRGEGTADAIAARGDDELLAAADRWLAEQLALARGGAVRAARVVEFGDPRDVLLACADGIGADLLVVGHHERTGGVGAGVGSVTRAVLRPTARAVLVVPPPVTSDAPRPDGRRWLSLVSMPPSARPPGDARRGPRPPAA
ncbi:MAG TPA: universal stress protein [Gemmatimonadaceae bacterium]